MSSSSIYGAEDQDKPKLADVVIVEWTDLVDAESSDEGRSINHDIGAALERAYGVTGTGILAIRGMPGFVAAKEAFLPLAHTLATQVSQEYRETHLTDTASLYNAGWSHGKEKLGVDKPPDTAKASFYYNPVTDLPGTPADRTLYPHSYPCNKWPDDAIIPYFQEKAVTIGALLKEACVMVAKHMDALAIRKCPSYTPHLLYNSLKGTDKVKARLLYYFPLEDEMDENEPTKDAEDSWIGWHNDSGFLTALAGDMYVDHVTGEPIRNGSPDPAAGLYVVDRCADPNRDNNNGMGGRSGILQVHVPPDCVAVQVGECTQIVTGGAVQATPHCVRGCRRRNHRHHRSNGSAHDDVHPRVARISLPCFVDTVPTQRLLLPTGCTREQVLAADCTDKVPPLAARWESDDADGMTFGDFLQKTFAMYYDWKQPV